MIQRTTKGILFLSGLLITSAIGLATGFGGGFFKKSPSLIDIAYADARYCSACGCPWTESQCANYTSGNGDSCCGAGPSADASSDTADAADAADAGGDF